MALTKVSRGLLSTSIVDNGNATAITIDASENVLVGKTAVGTNTAGFEARSTGFIGVTRADVGAYFTRLSTDGEIIQFRKDSAPVGSIGTEGSDLTIGTGDTGLQFRDASDAIRPFNISTNAARDASIDLGRSSERFRDLYLSGGAYLGGTAAANKLDDYEEGTWTGTLKGGTTEPATLKTAQGYYTKVGNTVTVHISFLNTDTTGYSGHVSVSGLPFGKNANNTRFTFKPALYNINIPGLDSFGFLESSGSTTVAFYSSRNNNSWSTVTHSAGTSRYIEFSFTYLTT